MAENTYRKPIKRAFLPHVSRVVGLSPKGHAVKKGIGKILPLTLAFTAAAAITAVAAYNIVKKAPSITSPEYIPASYDLSIDKHLKALPQAGDPLEVHVVNNRGVKETKTCIVSNQLDPETGDANLVCKMRRKFKGGRLSAFPQETGTMQTMDITFTAHNPTLFINMDSSELSNPFKLTDIHNASQYGEAAPKQLLSKKNFTNKKHGTAWNNG